MGLAACSIALGHEIPNHLIHIVPPIISCFSDADSKVRYFSCESMYNVAKVAKGEILIYFNELFDALSKLAADPDPAVKNGAELLDRLIKDIVTEQAATYISVIPNHIRSTRQSINSSSSIVSMTNQPMNPTQPSFVSSPQSQLQLERAFSLEDFIPLLRERIYNFNPFTRQYLVSWLQLLNSIPEINLVSHLPDFLDGLLKYLVDAGSDIQLSVQQLLADLLIEIDKVVHANDQSISPDMTISHQVNENTEVSSPLSRATTINPNNLRETITSPQEIKSQLDRGFEDEVEDDEDAELGTYVQGQGVELDLPAIVLILINWMHCHESCEETQATCLRWLNELIHIDESILIPFTPNLIPIILTGLSHRRYQVKELANEVNTNLSRAIENLPTPTPPNPTNDRSLSLNLNVPSSSNTRKRPQPNQKIPEEPLSRSEELPIRSDQGQIEEEVIPDPFDYFNTVNNLTLQFLNPHEETRLAALRWLIMLHQKVPDKILTLEDGTFPALLKTLSDESELVIRSDLQLLSQISLRSLSVDQDGVYYSHFMLDLLNLFGTDRDLLETRGNLIVRVLCQYLNPERIYKTFGEHLEKDEDLEFASLMVQNLNLIMITSPELSEMRKKLKQLETKDNCHLFINLYRSFSHNPISTLTLCLLTPVAYEHAFNLLSILANDMEITVGLLIQVDKLVQLLESPIFTSLRLQLLEPDKYPFLYKALYGILMLLPQSSAFATLRNRLGAVSTLGYAHAIPKT
ncbi:uncharacterized protein MELLADRAFT_47164 [Melampsora larici-populina 98AG31]|uniref:Vacuolar protein 14 C-terminal Fig4-binding domain-containing protein n=1 Tax=Melampsora larici-populina (strain 98AG31 / pathotype 3-4-7) TaxID=747676 RepID=F4RBB5_MELLP|nr:uncharacterized protein MELLADRAFT_47164 [Melampsora larici-populina 98AG31]EGG10056.1 hypothetical protein MELLADRAFT_47164 [Melampsora larici-populina 98AG31]